jgi:phosphoribosylanthranilate isomerase
MTVAAAVDITAGDQDALIATAATFVGTLFIQNSRRRFGRSVAEEVIHLKPPFQIVVVSREW